MVKVPQTVDEVEELAKLADHPQLDFWTDPGLNRKVYVMTTPNLKHSKILETLGFEIVASNIQELIQEEKKNKPMRKIKDGEMTWDDYYSYDQVTKTVEIWLRKFCI